MIALSLKDVSLSFGTDDILKNITFSVNDGDRVGIVGVNGAGKTSLFRLITGAYQRNSGEIYIQKGHTLGCLEQNPNLSALPGEMSCLEYMCQAFENLLRLEDEITKTEACLSGIDKGDEAAVLEAAGRLSELNRQYSELGGLEFRSRCRSMLLRLGFDEDTQSRKIKSLSGGEYTRLSLAKLLASEPDILMLDEPTNHLDIDALSWLEDFLSSYRKTVIIISHDRYFLDKITTKTLYIQNSKAELLQGNYTAAQKIREENADSLEHRYREQQKQIAKIKANIEFQRRCNREHNFVTIRSKEKQLARMEKIELAPPPPKNIRMSFLNEERSAGDVVLSKDLSFSYGDTPLIKNLSFLIRRGERVLILGKNGCGKSTLLKLINSTLTPTGGSVETGYNIKIGYYDQRISELHQASTVFEELRIEYPDKTDLELRSTLALFLFVGEDIDKPISILSGGERARLALAKLILKKVNLLILDEPTNHLDIGSAEALENALLAFGGTIIAVSHDRYFINRLATRIIELDSEKEGGATDINLEEYDDAYTEYIRIKNEAKDAALLKKSEAEIKKSSAKEDYENKKRENAKKRSDERKIEKAKDEVLALEEELEVLEKELFSDAATDYIRASEIEQRKSEIEERLLILYEIIM